MIDQNKLAEADRYLNHLARDFYAEPYSTATLGMAKIKRGWLKEGEELYRKAISLCGDSAAKKLFRQRMYMELGKGHLSIGEKDKAIKYLKKAMKEDDTYSYIASRINTALKQLLVIDES